MTTNAYLVYWCEEGLESVIPITEYEQWDRDNTFKILNNQEPARNPLNQMIQNMLLRARVNSQRHYELYAIDCQDAISKEDIAQMFEDDPQAAADLFRSRGHRLYSDRAGKSRVRIT
jgi:hypothetical protein